MGTVPLVTTLADPRNIATIVLFVILAHLAYAALSHNRALLMSLALIAIPFLPASNIFFPVGFVVAERVLYIPSMGYCLLVSLGFNTLTKLIPEKVSEQFVLSKCFCGNVIMFSKYQVIIRPTEIINNSGMNIVFEVEDLGHGLVFQNLAFYG